MTEYHLDDIILILNKFFLKILIYKEDTIVINKYEILVNKENKITFNPEEEFKLIKVPNSMRK